MTLLQAAQSARKMANEYRRKAEQDHKPERAKQWMEWSHKRFRDARFYLQTYRDFHHGEEI